VYKQTVKEDDVNVRGARQVSNFASKLENHFPKETFKSQPTTPKKKTNTAPPEIRHLH